MLWSPQLQQLLLLLHYCNFATVMKCIVHTWYAVYLLCDPKGVNDCLACTINMCYLKYRCYIHSVLQSMNTYMKHKVRGSIKNTLLLKLLTILLNFNLLEDTYGFWLNRAWSNKDWGGFGNFLSQQWYLLYQSTLSEKIYL